MSGIQFTWEEISLFVVTFTSCLTIIAYFACKRSTLNDHVTGDGSLGVWPLSMSLVATSLSSITFGYANEVYHFGPHIVFDALGAFLMGALTWCMIPVLHPLKLDTLNDYGALRFNGFVKLIMSVFALIYLVIHATLVSYSTALFVSQRLSYMTCFYVITLSCYFLTSIGGFAGVVWTDTVQAGAMLVSVVILAAIGLNEFGGPIQVFRTALESERLDFDWSFDLTKRLTVWTGLIAFSLQRISCNSIVQPCMYQRYGALSSQFDAKKAVIIHSLGVAVIISFTIVLGYILTGVFHGCDPVLSGRALKYDQVLPYFIEYIGERSLFSRSVYIIGFVSAAISTLSTDMNTSANILYKDYFHDCFPKFRGRKMVHFSGLLVVITSILTVQFMQNMGTVTDLLAVLNGPATIYASIVIIGIFLPWISSKALLWATAVSLVTISWISVGSHSAHSSGSITYPIKPMSVSNCSTVNLSIVSSKFNNYDARDVFFIFKITPFLHPTISIIIMLLVSILATLVAGSNDLSRLDRRLCIGWVRPFFPKRRSGEEVRGLTQLNTQVDAV